MENIFTITIKALQFATTFEPVKAILPILLLASASLSAHPNHENSLHPEDLDLGPSHQVTKAENEVKIKVVGNERLMTSNGIPDHVTGRFPNRNNPNTIEAQRHSFRMPLEPKPAKQPTEVRHSLFGVALNGVVFDPATAEYFDNQRGSEWNYEALSGAMNLGLDDSHAHVQPTGAYHYHGLPTALFERLSQGQNSMTLIGWASDGFPIYGLYGHRKADDATSPVTELRSSYQLKAGMRKGRGAPPGKHDGSFTADYEFIAGSGDLDECNGRLGVTPDFPNGTYHYILTKDYPFIPRLFRGSPDPSFDKRHGGRRGPSRALPERSRAGHPPHPGGPPARGDGFPPHGGPPPRRR